MKEWKRIIFSRNFLLLFMVLLLANGILYEWRQYTVKDEEKYLGEDFDYVEMKKDTIKEYRKLYSECCRMKDDEREGYLISYQEQLQEGPQGMAGYHAAAAVLSQIEYQKEYPYRYEKIKENAEMMLASSLFQNKNTFASKNIVKTVKDYKKTENLQIELFNDEWLTSWTEQKETNCFILLLAFYVVLQFFIERKNGLGQMIRSMKRGRIELALERAGVLLAASAVGTILLYGELWILAVYRYGTADIFSMLQSSPQFGNCIFLITVFGFMMHVLMNKILASFLCGLLLWLLMLFIAKSNVAIGIMGFIAAAEGICYVGISDLSNLKILKYCNLFALFDTESIYSHYINVNILGNPVHIVHISYMTFGMLLVILLPGVLLLSEKLYPNTKYFLHIKKMDIVKRWLGKTARHTSLVGHEGYKLLIPLFGVWIFALMLAIAWSQLDYSKVYYNGEDTYKNIFYREIQGKTEEEVQDYINEKQMEIQDLLKAEQEGNIKAENMKGALDEIILQQEYLKKLEHNRNIQGAYVNPLGYNLLLGENRMEITKEYTILQVFLLSVLFGGYLAYENQAQAMALICSTKRRIKGVWAAKLCLVLAGSMLVSIVFIAVELDNVAGRVGLAVLSAPVQSLQDMELFPLKISLQQFVFLAGTIRTLFLTVVGIIIAWISSKCKNVRSGILTSVAVTVLPLLIVKFFL